MRSGLLLFLLTIFSISAFSQSYTELTNQAIELGDKGDYVKAIAIAEKAVTQAKIEYGENHKEYANSLNTLGVMYIKTGQYKKTELLYLQATEIRKRILGDKHPDYANSLSNLGLLYLETGQYNKAESILTQSKDLHKQLYGETHAYYANCLNSLGVLYKKLGQYEKALVQLKMASDIFKKALGESHGDYILSLKNMADAYADAGQYTRAEPLYLIVKEAYLKTLGENHPLYADCLNSLAVFYSSMQQYEKALPFLLKAVEINKKILGKDHPDYAVTLDNLAGLYLHLGKFKSALPAAIEASEIRKRLLGTAHPDYAESLVALALLYQLTDQFDRAEQLLTEAGKIKKNALGENHPDYASCLNQLAAFYFRKQEYQKAEPLYIQAISIMINNFGQTGENYTTYANNLAFLYACMNQFEKAGAIVSGANASIIKNTLHAFPILSQKEKEQFLETVRFNFDFANSVLFNGHKREWSLSKNNLNQAVIVKSMALTETRRMLESIQNSSDTSIKKLFVQWSALKKILARQYALPVSNRASDLKKAELRTEELERELNRLSTGFRNQQATLQISMKDIQKRLSPDEAAVEFVRFQLYTKRWTDSIIYAAYIVRPTDSIPLFIPLCEEKQLGKYFSSISGEAAIKALYRGIIIDDEKKSFVSGDSLYSLIWKPLLPFLKGIKKIDYSPAGLLYKIAFHALPAGDSLLLLDKFELNQYVSLSKLALAEESQNNNIRIALFGNCTFSMDSATIVSNIAPDLNANSFISASFSRGENSGGWSSLPGTADEIKSIKSLFEKNKLNTAAYTQVKATEEQFKSLSGNSPAILHLATHGFFLPDPEKKKQEGFSADNRNAFTLADDPLLRSGIVLAGANRVWSGKVPIAGREDGIVTAYEIAQMDLHKTDLVVLSACETALGDIKGNEGVFGLQRAFKLAGVKNMLLSLWKVPDAETAELMKIFYSYYLQGKTAREAFTAAQKDMRKKYKPYYWAAFVLVE
jgi:CHAT domain-containing protein/tetratricopeptide (TPR) repeat protein